MLTGIYFGFDVSQYRFNTIDIESRTQHKVPLFDPYSITVLGVRLSHTWPREIIGIVAIAGFTRLRQPADDVLSVLVLQVPEILSNGFV
ncbi:hypothetical protein D3C85_1642890 [compost metagenome]